MSSISIQDLQKKYDNGFVALKDISLEIAKNEFVVLLGPSGCGKSTLLRTIAGLEHATSGTISIEDRVVNDVPPAQRKIAMVFQDYALYPHMSVRENLSFGLKIQKFPAQKIRERISRTAELLAISELLDHRPAQLSGGQRQRVAIGRALVKEPAVFLLDEPLSNLDAQLRARTRVEIADLHKRVGSTTIYVTHDQDEAMMLADRIVLMKAGEIQQVGRPMDIYRNPTNRFVASFLGNPSMNFLRGRIGLTGLGAIFEVEHERIPIKGIEHPLEPGEYDLGFRPEAAKPGPGFSAKLEGIESYGHEIRYRLRIGTQWVVLRSTPENKLDEKPIEGIQIDPSQIHWFEAETGKRVTRLNGTARSRHDTGPEVGPDVL